MIQKDEIEHIGWLARIERNKTDNELFGAHLSSIFDYFVVLDELDTEDA
jgi:aspartyl-tRNA(Asn)/glutamyl-tRNA(Gln) amidotransferase subunit C